MPTSVKRVRQRKRASPYAGPERRKSNVSARDLYTIWRTIAYIAGTLITLSAFLVVAIQWGARLGETDAMLTARICALQRRLDLIERHVQQRNGDWPAPGEHPEYDGGNP